VSSRFALLAHRDCSLRESAATKAVDRVDSLRGIDRIFLVASMGCYARCHLELDTVLSLAGEFL
jgi:hypothetical protein